jgi:hypothetical protein
MDLELQLLGDVPVARLIDRAKLAEANGYMQFGCQMNASTGKSILALAKSRRIRPEFAWVPA